MALLSIAQTAAYLGCAEGSLHNRAYRGAIGLQTIRLGNRLKFDERDLEALIVRLKERTPSPPKWLKSGNAAAASHGDGK